MTEAGICDHQLCACPVAEDSAYCSDRCRESVLEENPSIACDCGHPPCDAV